ncbi:hypothetical protein EAS54_22800 [Bradyrhizobium guangzhouense]|nr:hypothetical protein EAS54_22800 [Bradyrhizobium guangzhouense]
MKCDKHHCDQDLIAYPAQLQIGREWPLQIQQEADMEGQQLEISEPELTAEDLDSVSGGLRNNQTEAWAWFQIGLAKGIGETPGSYYCSTHIGS